MSGLGDIMKYFVLLTLLALIGNVVQCQGDSEEDNTDDDARNTDGLVTTYRSGAEKILAGFMKITGSGSSPSTTESPEQNKKKGSIGNFITSHITNPVKNIFNPVKNVTAKGFGQVLNLFESKFHAIFPGTRWCGGGNVASNEEDVGLFKKTDSCCRAHDNCPSNIEAGATNGRLLNNGIFTRSACFCDTEFYNCLKNVSSVVSANIGKTYFNLLRPQCFSNDYPIRSCAEYAKNRLTEKKCLKYDLDQSQDKKLQWFDSPDY